MLFLVYDNKNELAKIILKDNSYSDMTKLVNNQYSSDKSYSYVKLTDNFIAYNKNDLLNILYTILNSGMDSFTFYCDDKYKECMNDVDVISKDRIVLSNINNFIHPYNSFTEMETTRYTNSNKIKLNIKHLYNKDKINKINNKVTEIIKNEINDDDNKDKIKTIHDYIINNTKYDELRVENNISKYSSDTAYGPLFEGFGICNGYSDLMKIFLHELGIESIKIASENHIWNLVKLDNKWYHLDLTWDDPVLENGKDIIDYNYFMIDTKDLIELNDNQHFYNKDIYKGI